MRFPVWAGSAAVGMAGWLVLGFPGSAGAANPLPEWCPFTFNTSQSFRIMHQSEKVFVAKREADKYHVNLTCTKRHYKGSFNRNWKRLVEEEAGLPTVDSACAYFSEEAKAVGKSGQSGKLVDCFGERHPAKGFTRIFEIAEVRLEESNYMYFLSDHYVTTDTKFSLTLSNFGMDGPASVDQMKTLTEKIAPR